MGIAGASQILTQEHIAAQSAQEKIVQEFVEFHGKGISKTSQKSGDPTLETDFETIHFVSCFRGVFSSIH